MAGKSFVFTVVISRFDEESWRTEILDSAGEIRHVKAQPSLCLAHGMIASELVNFMHHVGEKMGVDGEKRRG